MNAGLQNREAGVGGRTASALAVSVLGCALLSVSPIAAAPREAPGATLPPAIAPAIPEPPATEPVPPHRTFMLPSKILGETRRINLFLPRGYDEASPRSYLVLYMLDGGVAEDFPHVAADVDAAERAGAMRPVIVVGIENTERRRDLTGPTTVASDRKIAPHIGGSVAFRAFLRDELLPEIGLRVRASEQRAIVGESLAGLFVLETFFEEPDLFDTYVALSPSLWWNDGALARGAAAALRTRLRKPATLYFATASDDGTDDAAKSLANALGAASLPDVIWLYEPRPDLQHGTIYRGASPGVLRRLFPPQR